MHWIVFWISAVPGTLLRKQCAALDLSAIKLFGSILVALSPMLDRFRMFFGSFLGGLGHWQNSWKCVTIIKFRGFALPNGIIFGDFFEGALREASGTCFFEILSDFGLPVGAHLAPKRHQKMRPKKWWKKGIHSKMLINQLCTKLENNWDNYYLFNLQFPQKDLEVVLFVLCERFHLTFRFV